MGAHLDEAIIDKVRKGVYIDFAQLLPRKKQFEEDHRLELIYEGGQTYFLPVAEREGAGGGITNLHNWEQAFRVFSNIYLKEFPHKATELIQYNHIICTAAASYIWENVYAYDKEFRMHLSKYPDHSWGVILQQAWMMILKDHVKFHGNEVGKNNRQNGKRKKEICKRFNKGLCTAGLSCKYDHRCLECGKFGHGVHICRR